MTVDEINMIIKSFFVNLFSIMIFYKIVNYGNIDLKQKIQIGFSIIILVIIELFLKKVSDFIITMIIIILVQSILLSFITRHRKSNVLISVIISIASTYLLYMISGTIEFFIQTGFNIKSKIVNCSLIFVIEYFIMYLIFKIRRLKDGLQFLQKQNEYMEVAIINISIILILVYFLIGYNYSPIIDNVYFYYILLGIFMIIIIQKTIVMHYKQKLIDDTINQYKTELQEKDNEIRRLTGEVFEVSKVNHEFYNRQKSLEMMVKSKLKSMDFEAAEEIDILSRIEEITDEHSEKMRELKSLSELPLTGVGEIDDMFKYMQKECQSSGINFRLNVNGNIHYLVNNLIQKSKFVTLIGDHIRDAIIAINSGDCSNKEIFVILGVKDDYYELCIYDSGIEFEIQTLLNLGRIPITTHKDSGGTGIGFITTFETLKECNASLIIEEKHSQNDSDYTKAVIIRFDGKNEYRISSYRLEEIKKECRDNRIIFI